jgi:hypothetical protein
MTLCHNSTTHYHNQKREQQKFRHKKAVRIGVKLEKPQQKLN